MTDTRLEVQSTTSNSNGLSNVRTGLDNLKRDFGLKFSEDSDGFRFMPFSGVFVPERVLETKIPLTSTALFGITKDCRQTWQDKLVNYKETKGLFAKEVFPFQEAWDFQPRADLLRRLAPALAVAGERMFYLIFEEPEDEDLLEAAKMIREEAATKQLTVTITSDVFFVPWGMMYTHPKLDEQLAGDGSNFRWEGFWGYSHIIEHNTRKIDGDTRIRTGAGDLVASINIDENIDEKLSVDSIRRQREFFKHLHDQKLIKREERTRKEQLQKALEGDAFSDRLLYFYCHGMGADRINAPNLEDAKLTLTDGNPITAKDIAYWIRKEKILKSKPLVFINACQGGQMSTLFYKTLAAEFLKLNAIGLIGSQIDIPALFAVEYAQRLLSEFINPALADQNTEPRPKTKLGPLMRKVTRELIDKHNNPLGLVYSLYRGADCYIDRGSNEDAG